MHLRIENLVLMLLTTMTIILATEVLALKNNWYKTIEVCDMARLAFGIALIVAAIWLIIQK